MSRMVDDINCTKKSLTVKVKATAKTNFPSRSKKQSLRSRVARLTKMLAQRVTQQSLRRLAAAQPFLAPQLALKRLAAPAALTASSIQTRLVATQQIGSADSHQILAEQRKRRPTAPHLSIYRPQITWYASALNRITGATLSGGFYLFGAAYLTSPLLGWHLDSATMAAAFGGLPLALKVATKFAVAMPFTFHCFNGVRHLVWDLGKEFSNKQVIRTGWIVVGISTASAIGLATLV